MTRAKLFVHIDNDTDIDVAISRERYRLRQISRQSRLVSTFPGMIETVKKGDWYGKTKIGNGSLFTWFLCVCYIILEVD